MSKSIPEKFSLFFIFSVWSCMEFVWIRFFSGGNILTSFWCWNSLSKHFCTLPAVTSLNICSLSFLFKPLFLCTHFMHVVSFQCMCGECAKELRLQSNKCPICRQPIEQLIGIKINSGDQWETVSCIKLDLWYNG